MKARQKTLSSLITRNIFSSFLLVFVLGACASVGVAVYSTVKDVQKTIRERTENFTRNEIKAFQFFDYIRLNEVASTYFSNDLFSSVEVIDSYGNLAVFLGPSMEPNTLVKQEFEFAMSSIGPALRFSLAYPMMNGPIKIQGLATLHRKLQHLLLYLSLILVTAASAFLVCLWMIRLRLRRAVQPIVALSNRIGSFESFRSLVEDPEVIKIEVQEVERFVLQIIRLGETVDRLQTKAAQDEKYKVIAQTAQMIAHDIRKPLSMVEILLTFLSRAKSAEQVKSIVQQFVPKIKKISLETMNMVQDLLEIGSTRHLVRDRIDLRALLRRIAEDLLAFESAPDINFEFQLDSIATVTIDSSKIERVISNIIANAVKAMKGQGRIWIRTTSLESMVQITIGNSNSYIPPQDLNEVFDAFFSKASGGTGLGLAIAKKVVTDHGGSIWCRSSKEWGTEFCFTLPIAN